MPDEMHAATLCRLIVRLRTYFAFLDQFPPIKVVPFALNSIPPPPLLDFFGSQSIPMS